MSDTLNIVYSRQSPGTFAMTYSVYGANLRVYRSGLSTTAGADHTATAGVGITLGAAGSITLDLVAIDAALSVVDASESIWTYTLEVVPTGSPDQPVCSGYLVRRQP